MIVLACLSLVVLTKSVYFLIMTAVSALVPEFGLNFVLIADCVVTFVIIGGLLNCRCDSMVTTVVLVDDVSGLPNESFVAFV